MTVIESLRAKISEANKAYWDNSKPIMSDVEYDKLVEQLRKLSPNDPLLNEVEGATSSDPTRMVKHVKQLLSLGKSYSWDGILQWMRSVARTKDEVFMVSPKYDGLCCEIQADTIVSRGRNGKSGLNITHLADKISEVYAIDRDETGRFEKEAYALAPLLEHSDATEYMVGELIVPKWRFKKLKEEFPDIFGDYKTPRSMASGFANSSPESDIANLHHISDKGYKMTPVVCDIVKHRAYELPVAMSELYNPATRQEIEETLHDLLDYPTDGLVFRLKDEAYAESLGNTAHHPRGSLALKWTFESKETIVKSIDWQVGERHITPVANFDPIILDNTEVKRATLHTVDFVEQNEVCVGSEITVEKRGGVIPKVNMVINHEPPHVVIPVNCPGCGSKLVRDGKFLNCNNENCKGKIVNRIFRGLHILGVKGVGPSLIERVVSDLMIPNIMVWCKEAPDGETLYAKGYTAAEIAAILKIKKVMEEGVTPSQLLQSVTIPKVGESFASAVEKYHGDLMSLIRDTAVVDDMYTMLVDVSGVNLDALTQFMIWMELYREDFVAYAEMFRLKESVAVPETAKKIIFTGTGPYPRERMMRIAALKGYAEAQSIAQADLLVCANVNGNSSKLKKARARNMPIMTYAQFLGE